MPARGIGLATGLAYGYVPGACQQPRKVVPRQSLRVRVHVANDLQHLKVGGRKAYPTQDRWQGFPKQGTPGRPKGLPGVFVWAPEKEQTNHGACVAPGMIFNNSGCRIGRDRRSGLGGWLQCACRCVGVTRSPRGRSMSVSGVEQHQNLPLRRGGRDLPGNRDDGVRSLCQ